MRYPWDQLREESNEAYARFLAYRNIGPKRSLKKAYRAYFQASGEEAVVANSSDPPPMSGQWYADCAAFKWVDRAAAWDVHNLMAYGAHLAVLHVATVTIIAKKCARKAAQLEPGDKGWAALLESVRLVGEYLTPDVIRGIHEHQQSLCEPLSAPAGPGGAGG